MSKFGALGVDPKTTSRMEIVLPGDIEPLADEKGNVAYIEFLPWDSEPGRKFEREQQITNVRKGFRQRSRAELLKEAETSDAIAEQANRLTALVVGWYLVDPKTRQVIDEPFTAGSAHELFSEPDTAWIRRQAWVYVANEANFMKSSSKT